MSSEDDYYIDLYERHRDARAGRRARRRGSGEVHDLRRGCGGYGRYFSRKRRRRPTWFAPKFARLCGVILLALFLIYEFYILRSAHPRRISGRISRSRSTEKTRGPNSVFVVDDASKTVLPEASGESKGSLLASTQQPPPTDSLNVNGDSKITSDTSSTSLTEAVSDARTNSQPDSSSNQRMPLRASRAIDFQSSSAVDVGSVESKVGDNTDIQKDNGTQEGQGSSLAASSSKRTRRKRSSQSREESKTRSSRDGRRSISIGRREKRVEDESADEDANDSELRTSKREWASSSSMQNTSAKRHSSRGGREVSKDHGAEPGASENFWQWFQESKGSEAAGASGVECPQMNHKLCQMFYKYIRKYKIRAIFDASCSKNLDWIHIPLRKVGNELWGFKYICGETQDDKIEEARAKFEGLKFVEFDSRRWWREGFPDDVELLFAWDTLSHTAFGRVWSFFVHARKQEIKWILVDNYPTIMNDPSPKREFINLRRHPFRFPAATAVVQDVREVGEDESVKRQLLLYESSLLPENLGG